MNYVINKNGDFDSAHEVHKETCPHRPHFADVFVVNDAFDSDLSAVNHTQKTYPTFKLRPCTACMDMSAR